MHKRWKHGPWSPIDKEGPQNSKEGHNWLGQPGLLLPSLFPARATRFNLIVAARLQGHCQAPMSCSNVVDGIQSPCVSPRYLAGSSHCLGTLCKKKSWTKWLYWCLPYRHIGNILLSYSITQPLRQELSSKCMQSRKYLEKGHSFCLTATCRCVKRYKHQVVLPQSCIRCTSCVIKENFKKYIHHVTLMLDIHISRTLSVLKTK